MSPENVWRETIPYGAGKLMYACIFNTKVNPLSPNSDKHLISPYSFPY